MQRGWSEAEFHDSWSISPEERIFLQNKPPETRPGCAILLKSFQIQGYFPRSHRDIPEVVVLYLASQLETSPEGLATYHWSGGTGKRHRQHVRTFLNIRRASRNDREQFATWLQEEAIPSDYALRAIQDMALTWFRDQRLDPPAESRLDRLIRSTLHQHETKLFTHIAARLSPHTKSGIDRLLISPEVAETETSDMPSGPLGFTNLKADPGRIDLNSLLKELAKLDRLRKLELSPLLPTCNRP